MLLLLFFSHLFQRCEHDWYIWSHINCCIKRNSYEIQNQDYILKANNEWYADILATKIFLLTKIQIRIGSHCNDFDFIHIFLLTYVVVWLVALKATDFWKCMSISQIWLIYYFVIIVHQDCGTYGSLPIRIWWWEMIVKRAVCWRRFQNSTQKRCCVRIVFFLLRNRNFPFWVFFFLFIHTK